MRPCRSSPGGNGDLVLARTEPAPRHRPPRDLSVPAQRDDRPLASPAARWADLKLRVLSTAVLVPLALAAIWIGGATFAGLVALITIGLGYEWLVLCGQRSAPAAALPFAALPLAVALGQLDHAVSALLLLGLATAAATALGRAPPASRLFAFGIPYLGLAAVALVWLRRQAGGADVVVLLLVIWASDIAAYAAGRAIGGPRLAPIISPGKTWSGAIAGLLAAACVGFAASAILGSGPASARPVGFAVLIGFIAQLGDLLESRLKRQFGVKDSGSMIPGHGGLLDRLDAVLTAAPAMALLVLILGPGVMLWE